ncbi:cysteine-rich repeat secretory protein 38 [Phtheirospermum japonicum]|uniref:Cysteine-rich repeat secretory protein 38 n=1 Tax=Phtheirospermum japonicum TaxID=374723 RepID=A0A830CL69_9LAMI|nr:cysteine-rich repeat secretory protein 38 [Phtheirospermum japonicum]
MGHNNNLISSSIILILLISSLLPFPVAFSDQDSGLIYNCTTIGKFTPGSDYQQSLLYVVDELTAKAPLNNGFYNTTRAEGNNVTYGLALCRGDISADDCTNCLTTATMEVANTDCLGYQGAIIWRDYCMLKYSNLDFFGIIDEGNHYYLRSQDYTSPNFTAPVLSLLSGLSETAILVPDKLFASGSVSPATLPETFYAMVQCTRDISVADCGNCLDYAISYLATCCATKGGSRFVSGSCNVRYETYNFLNN